jgi:carboxypeptidase Taq
MPRGAAGQRSEEMGAIEGILHARRTDPRLADWLAAAEPLDEVAAAQLRHIARSHARMVKVPGALAEEIARVTSMAQGIWAEARANDDVAAFLPVLDSVVRLLGAPGQPAPLQGHFGTEGQLRLARDIATAFGYDWSRGRLDIAVHPFSSGSGSDARITTRVVETDPFNCLYSTIHEVGHACYELGIDPDFALTPLGAGVSMGVHESQSRIYENQLGRSRAFCGWLFGQMSERFGPFGIADANAFFGAVNRVQSGFIRTEADEVHYNLHIMMRFDLERALIRGDLVVADLEAAWNDRFLADFGVAVDRPAHGMLQDVHWSVGLFGYFPTYALGNVYAGCLHLALRGAVPDLDDRLSRGETAAATGWLRENLQRHGGLYSPRDTVARACGFEPNEGPLLDYLEAKFGALYRL